MIKRTIGNKVFLCLLLFALTLMGVGSYCSLFLNYVKLQSLTRCWISFNFNLLSALLKEPLFVWNS